MRPVATPIAPTRHQSHAHSNAPTTTSMAYQAPCSPGSSTQLYRPKAHARAISRVTTQSQHAMRIAGNVHAADGHPKRTHTPPISRPQQPPPTTSMVYQAV